MAAAVNYPPTLKNDGWVLRSVYKLTTMTAETFYREYYSLENGELSENAKNICEMMEAYAASKGGGAVGLWDINYYPNYAISNTKVESFLASGKDEALNKFWEGKNKENYEVTSILLRELTSPASSKVEGLREASGNAEILKLKNVIIDLYEGLIHIDSGISTEDTWQIKTANAILFAKRLINNKAALAKTK